MVVHNIRTYMYIYHDEYICEGLIPSLQPKRVKNVSRDSFGSKLGRVHMKRQDFSHLQTRKMKGLKRTKPHDQDGPQETKKVKLDHNSQ